MSSKQYLKITNIGTVSRKYLELLGASDKRGRLNDNSVIGNKGSGAKLAPIPALRLGMEIAVSSCDSEGEYVLKYETQTVDLGSQTMQQIVFNYVGDRIFPSQLTTDAFQDWDRPIGDDSTRVFKIVREYICNAWDEDKNFIMEEVDGITQANENMTSVFISITDEIKTIMENLPKYFKLLSGSKPVHDCTSYPFGSIYLKSEERETRLFSQGVLVDCKKSHYYASIFDYSLDGKHLLSEERVIKNFSEYMEALGNLLMTIKDKGLIDLLLISMIKGHAKLEIQAIANIKSVPDELSLMFRNSWQALHGKKAVMSSGVVQIDGDAENKGYTLVSGIDSSLRTFLKRCGVATSKDVAVVEVVTEDNKPTFEVFQLEGERKNMLDIACALFCKYYPPAVSLPSYVFRALDYRMRDTLGHTGDGARQHKEIWINESVCTSVRKILEILVHEGRHCFTKAGDYDRKFTQQADAELVDLMLSNAVPPTKNTWNAQVVPNRGILLPRRFVGSDVQVMIGGSEIFMRISGKNGTEQIAYTLQDPFLGSLNQSRRIVQHKNMGCVFLPESILGRLPQKMEVTIQ